MTVATHPNFVAGERTKGIGAFPDVNPSDLADVIGEYASSDTVQVDTSVEAALAAQPAWAATTPAERFTTLEKVGAELAARASELGELLSREEGKPRAEGIAEVQRAAWIFKFFAGEALRTAGEHVRSVRPGVDVDVLREPLGVVGVITPWNFPIAIPAWKIAPALAYGNAVVFKPAQLVPASGWALAEILSRADLPPGTFNFVNGSGGTVGERLVHHAKVRGITFTGSQAVGKQVALACAERFARAQLEMGGKNPLVVLDDADLDVAVECAVQGAFFQTGQRCTASSRLIVAAGIHDAFVESTVAAMKALRVGHALEDETQIGPVVDETQLRQDEEYIRIATGEGAEIAWGGERLERDTEGFYLSPALLVRTTNDMRVNREEIFGPIATVVKVADADEALAVANDTEYGLSAGVCTTSLKHAARFRDGLQAGIVTVNLPTAGVDFHVPFGGTKGSSQGTREQGRYAIEFFTTVKTAYVRP
ncbi:MAG TPA: aldehyde dehydrogenase family protein [Actinomycetota bacterium]|nr:aldehyde dehydrogenase family protein [Actinomycetota bacterium]